MKTSVSPKVDKPRQRKPRAALIDREAFVNRFRETFNVKEAALAAGFAESGAMAHGSRMLRDPQVVELLARLTLNDRSVTSVRVGEVIQAMREIAFLDPLGAFEKVEVVSFGRKYVKIRLRDISDMPLEVRRAIASIKVVRRNLVSGDGVADDMYEVKFWDKNQALDKLAQHLGMLTLKVEHTVTAKHLEQMSDEDLATAQAEALERWRRHVQVRDRMRGLPDAERS